jgi:LPS-assembly lipoprotein
MTDARSVKTIFEGQSLAVTSFDVLSSEFGTLTAEKDARRRAVIDLAQDMRNRIAVFFSKVRARGRE